MARKRKVSVAGAIADGTLTLTGKDLDDDFGNCELAYIHFFNGGFGNDNRVAATAGTVLVEYSPDGFVYKTVENGEFEAAQAYTPDRKAPYGEGCVEGVRVTLSDIVGATHARAVFWQNGT